MLKNGGLGKSSVSSCSKCRNLLPSSRSTLFTSVVVVVLFLEVSLKTKYNDAYKSSKNLSSGNEWYCHQAFRTLNQAADEPYRDERKRAYVSKWLRKSIRQYDSFESNLEGLKSFFSYVKERGDKNMVNVSQISDTNEKNCDIYGSK